MNTSTEFLQETCGGERTPELPAGYLSHGSFGDSRFVGEELSSVQEQSLISGALTPLFDLEEGSAVKAMAVDGDDIFAIEDFELHRYNRTSGVLESFAEAPESPVESTFLGTTTYRPFVSVSDTSVFTVAYDTEGTAAGGVQFRTYVAIYSRATGELELVPTDSSMQLEVHGDRLFFAARVDPAAGSSSDWGMYQYNPETDAEQLVVQSPNEFGENSHAFWQDDLIYAASLSGSGYQLFRVPLSGGTSTLLLDELSDNNLKVVGNKAYAKIDADVAGRSEEVITEVDLVTGESRSLGPCVQVISHSSEQYLYLSESFGRPDVRIAL
jgi:hypothetical protein